MRRQLFASVILASAWLAGLTAVWAGQAPGAASDPDIPVSHHDRVYSAEQFSNTVSVTDPVDNKLLGVIRLGDPQPGNFSPLYKGQVLVHGMGFSPDHRTIAVVSIGSNSVTFIDTATNEVKHTAYVGRSPHEAFYTPDGSEVWVTVRGEDYIAVLDGQSFEEKSRIKVPAGPGMQIFSPDGKYGYVCFSNRPFGVKHFQTIHLCGVDVARGLVLLFGIGTMALPSWDSKTRRNNLLDGLAVNRTAGPSRHADSPHPSSREGHLSTARWISIFSYRV